MILISIKILYISDTKHPVVYSVYAGVQYGAHMHLEIQDYMVVQPSL